jgi:hypothetical protein
MEQFHTTLGWIEGWLTEQRQSFLFNTALGVDFPEIIPVVMYLSTPENLKPEGLIGSIKCS